MEQQFYDYLVREGFSEYTKSGRKSTVYSYCNRINLVCEIENLDWHQLSKNIYSIIPKYDHGGIHEDVGMRSSKTCINALKAFAKFCEK